MIARENLQDIYPLSPLQEGMLFDAILRQNSQAYFEQLSYRVAGPLDLDRFEAAWNELFKRHDIFRTAFIYEKTKRPLQIVLKERRIDFRVEDLAGLSRPEQDLRIAGRRQEDRARGFNLATESLVRIIVLKLGAERFEIIWSHHHILMDGWCVARVQSEFLAIYQASKRGGAPDLPPVAPYRQYIQWLETRGQESSLGHWQNYLAGYARLATFPKKLSPAPGAAYELRRPALELEKSVADDLALLGREWGVTLNTLVRGAWGILLSRFNRTSDVVFGAVVSGRPAELPAVEQMVGLFINTIPVRARITDGPGRDYFRRLQEEAIENEPHHYCALSDIQARSGLKQSLFDHLLVFENYPTEGLLPVAENEFAIERAERFEQTNYDLVLVVEPGTTIRFEIHFNGQVFDHRQISAIAAHLRLLLVSIAARPDAAISELPLLTPGEEKDLLAEVNPAPSPFPRDASVHALFEAQAERTPEAPALIFGEARLSYRELNRRAGDVAARLRELGVGQGALAGVYLERSAEMVIGFLAILKAGAAYVPLDPAYPAERIAWMINDARISVLLTTARWREKVPETIPLLLLDQPFSPEAREPPVDSRDRTGGANLAYVIYTSGSTGKPKGVAVPHRAIVRLLCHTNYIRIEPGHKVAQASNSSFDAATFEIWGALLGGGCLVGVPREITLGPEEFASFLDEEKIDVLFLTTALFNQVVWARPSAFSGLTFLLFGGERVDPGTVHEVLQNGRPKHLLHVYGPTESTTFASFFSVTDVGPEDLTVPIGRPLSNTRLYLLDAQLRPAPVGMPGEIYIGGDGLAWGYLNEPELTARKFIPDPFGGDPGERLYKTGDLARYRPGGDIEFLGRLDGQIKLRGFRIEPEEIETALLECPGIREAAVIVRDAGGDGELVGYFTESQPLAFSTLREHLRGKLPDYLVPGAFARLEAFPLNPNGKIDRAALPPLAMIEAAAAGYVAPGTPTETAVSAIWEEVLGRGRIGLQDNFFDLGGHSLKATRVVSRIRNQFRLDLPLRVLFEGPTVRELAEHIDRKLKEQGGVALPEQPALVRRARVGRETASASTGAAGEERGL